MAPRVLRGVTSSSSALVVHKSELVGAVVLVVFKACAAEGITASKHVHVPQARIA